MVFSAAQAGLVYSQPTLSTVPPVVPNTNFGGVTFNLSTSQSAILMDTIYCVFNSVTSGTATLNGYSVWYRTTPISSAPNITSPTWMLLDTFSLVPANTAAVGTIMQAIPKSFNFLMQPNSSYGFFIGNFTIQGGVTYGSAAPGGNTTPTFTDGQITIASGQNITYGGQGPLPAITPRYFAGGVKYKLANRSPNDAGATAITSPVNFCPNTSGDVKARIRNFGMSQLSTVQVNWSADGILQTPFQFSGVLDTIGGTGANDTLLTLGAFAFGSTPVMLKAWTSLPNGFQDTVNNNDTISTVIQPAFSGIYTVGGSGAVFPTLDSAIASINRGGLCGPVDLQITGNTTVATPLVLQDVTFGFPLNIKPLGGAFTISGNVAGALLRVAGADNIIIDGDNQGQPGGLTLSNTSTATNSAVLHFSNASNGSGCRNIQMKNLNIIGGTNSVVSAFGITISGPTITTTSTGGGHGNILIENNRFTNAYFGLYARGLSTSLIDSLVIRNNTFGSPTTANTVSFRGLDIQSAASPLVEGNLFQNITIGTTVSIGAMDVGANVTSARIERNTIRNVIQTNTTGGAYGISVTGGTGFLLVNNVITGVLANNALNNSQLTNAFGIRISSGTGHRLYYNSVNMHGNYTNTSTTAMASAALVVASTAVTGLDIRNNIFANTIIAATTGVKSNVAVWFPASYNFTGTNITTMHIL